MAHLTIDDTHAYLQLDSQLFRRAVSQIQGRHTAVVAVELSSNLDFSNLSFPTH